MKDNTHLISGERRQNGGVIKRDFMEEVELEMTFKGRQGLESKSRKKGSRCFKTRSDFRTLKRFRGSVPAGLSS